MREDWVQRSLEGGLEPFAFRTCPLSNAPDGEGGVVTMQWSVLTGTGFRSSIMASTDRALLPQHLIICFTKDIGHYIPYIFCVCVSFFFFCLFRVAPAAYGGSQASSPIRAIAAGLHHSPSNAGSKLCL